MCIRVADPCLVRFYTDLQGVETYRSQIYNTDLTQIKKDMVYAIKKPKETTAALLRRFTKNVQQSGLLLEARKGRFHAKKSNRRARKASALRRIARRKEIERLQKLGKLEKKEGRPGFKKWTS